MSLPATTGFGEAVFVTVISACAVVPTTVVAIAVLFNEFGSNTAELTVAVSVIAVPLATPVFTFTTSANVPAVPPAMLKSVQTTLPVKPTEGVLQTQPDGADIETKVVFAGVACTKTASSAALGPLLVTTCA
jgi:hypothetical protein